jgi:hypothetical protein
MFAYHVGRQVAQQLSAGQQKALAETVAKASPEQLALFRERVKSGARFQDGDGVKRLLAG